MAKASNQKLKLLYLMQIFMRETDDEHMLTMQEIINLLANAGIRTTTIIWVHAILSCRSSSSWWIPCSPPSSSQTANPRI